MNNNSELSNDLQPETDDTLVDFSNGWEKVSTSAKDEESTEEPFEYQEEWLDEPTRLEKLKYLAVGVAVGLAAPATFGRSLAHALALTREQQQLLHEDEVNEVTEGFATSFDTYAVYSAISALSESDSIWAPLGIYTASFMAGFGAGLIEAKVNLNFQRQISTIAPEQLLNT